MSHTRVTSDNELFFSPEPVSISATLVMGICWLLSALIFCFGDWPTLRHCAAQRRKSTCHTEVSTLQLCPPLGRGKRYSCGEQRCAGVEERKEPRCAPYILNMIRTWINIGMQLVATPF